MRDLRNYYLKLMEWVAAGEVVIITKRGRPIARLSPVSESATSAASIDWSQSPAVARDRSGEAVLTAAESEEVLRESSGKW